MKIDCIFMQRDLAGYKQNDFSTRYINGKYTNKEYDQNWTIFLAVLSTLKEIQQPAIISLLKHAP